MIYLKHTIHLQELGLDHCQIKTLDHKLNKHAVQYATKLIQTRYALHNNQRAQGVGLGASARNPPDPHLSL